MSIAVGRLPPGAPKIYWQLPSDGSDSRLIR